MGFNVITTLGTTPTVVKLDEEVGTGASGVLEFTSIPATYRHLMLIITGRSDTAATSAGIRLTFESSPTSGAYNHQQLQASNTTVAATENIGSNDFISFAVVPAASSTANVMTTSSLMVFEYANTGIFKTVGTSSFEPATVASSNINVRHTTGLWESTAAIDRIRLTLSAGNWTTLSRVSLYGVPG